MPDRANLIYRCDGSLPGLLCCVFESRRTHRLPMGIWDEEDPRTTLAPELTIPTNREEAVKVWRALRRLSPDAAHWAETAFLSGEEDKAVAIHDLLWETFERNRNVTGYLGDPVVARAFQLQRQVHNEAQMFIEFLRFKERRGVLAAQIEPKAFVLPLIGGHFAARFPGEAFLIHDLTHGAALLHQRGRMEIFPLEELSEEAASSKEAASSDETANLKEAANPDEEKNPEEEGYQQLWRRYYDTIAIRERYNPRCRMGHCPKRFWNHMLEMEGAVSPSAARLPEGQ